MESLLCCCQGHEVVTSGPQADAVVKSLSPRAPGLHDEAGALAATATHWEVTQEREPDTFAVMEQRYSAGAAQTSTDVDAASLVAGAATSAFGDPDRQDVMPAPSATSGLRLPVPDSLKRGISTFSAGSARSGERSHDNDGSLSRSGGSSPGAALKKAGKWGWMLSGSDEDDGAAFPRAANFISEAPGDERFISYTCVETSSYPKSVNLRRGGQPNKMVTTRFTLLTWLPLSLMAQFKRVANIYFLYICVLVCFESWSPKDWKAKVLPFLAVLLWTACKDLFEDWRRRRDDHAVNAQQCRRLNKSRDGFEVVQWKDVHVGDLLYIAEDAAFPADLLLLHAAGGAEAFISTVMLDGETSLKDRQAPSPLEVVSSRCSREQPGADEWCEAQLAEAKDGQPFPFARLEKQLVRFSSLVTMDIKFACPTANLADVRGVVQPHNDVEDSAVVCPFTETNFLPRGCVLRNTAWVVAIALYVGDETKSRLNSMQSSRLTKFSNMQVNLNSCIRGLLVCLFTLCSLATVVAEVPSLDWADGNEYSWIVMFFRFCITFYHLVPLSLYVMYELLKLFLGFRLNKDPQMVDPDTGEGAIARTADLMEEMGQVDFIFSDKTGTLTANVMVFAKCHIDEEDLGDFRSRPSDAPEHVPDGLARAREVLSAASDRESRDAHFDQVLSFFTCLAVCHSVVTSTRLRQMEKGSLLPSDSSVALPALAATANYAGASPDEVALVEAAHAAGVSFSSRVRKHSGTVTELNVTGPGDLQRKFTLVYELPFSSDRKRMSVIVRHRGAIWCVTKGADSVMEERLREPFTPKCQEHIAEFSRSGLRTLVVAMKKVDPQEFDRWDSEYRNARNVIDETKERGIAEVASKMEQGLHFVGVTAVEDKLQVGVPEAIGLVKEMGIRVWVLTGDKTETAVDIAKSCRLFDEQTQLAYAVKADSAKNAEDLLLKAYSELDGKDNPGIVLDGQTLLHALKSPECRKIVYDLGIVSRSCICTRLSPKQKLQLVQLVREHDTKAITLAIGDGANDVPMIYGAHVGVAVRGKEGTQAVQACDVAVSQFSFLVPLLQCHGRRAYRRVALFLCFFLYKNVALIMLDVIWMVQDRFQARIAVPEWLSIQYNAFFTSLHILFVLGLDRDIPDEVANSTPDLYKVGPRRELLNASVFSKWMVFAAWHGAAAWVIPYWLFQVNLDLSRHDYDKTQKSVFWLCSIAAFTAVILVVCLKLAISSENPCGLHTVLPTSAALLAYACYLYGISEFSFSPQASLRGIWPDFFQHQEMFTSILLAVGVALLPDLVETAARRALCPSKLQLAKRQSSGTSRLAPGLYGRPASAAAGSVPPA